MPDPGLEAQEVERWVEEYAPELRSHLRRMLGSEDVADDVLQEVWITAHRNPPGEELDRNVRAWLYRVATREALDALTLGRRRTKALEEKSGEVQPAGPRAPDAFLDGVGPDGRRRVREELARLPRKQREAVWLRWGLGWEYGRVSERLECSRESARANVHHGLTRLRERLSDLWKEMDL